MSDMKRIGTRAATTLVALLLMAFQAEQPWVFVWV